jgi:hypothetical protein
MSTQKQKFELFARLQAMGFTYEESAQLRRIEMTLQRWAERECGDGSNWAIERAEPRKLAIWHDPEVPDGLRVVALDCNGRFECNIKRLPAHLKQDKNPDVFPEQAIQILAVLQQRENEDAGRPYNVYHGEGKPHRYAIADREAGALRRLKAIVGARNARNDKASELIGYHQSDPRGAALYLVPRSTLCNAAGEVVLEIDSYYNRGLAVCC